MQAIQNKIGCGVFPLKQTVFALHDMAATLHFEVILSDCADKNTYSINFFLKIIVVPCMFPS